MAGLVRDALWDNALDLVNGDGFVEETDLTIIPWNRTTVADGQWLQDHAIGPLSARDVYLADEIQKNVDAIDSIKTTLVDYGMVAGSASGSSGAAVNLVNAGGVRTINYKAVGDNSESNWGDKPTSIVPGSESEAGAPAFTLGYMTLGNGSRLVDGAALITNGRSCIIQGNCAKGNANQLLMLPDGVYYRSLATTSPQTMSQYGLSYDSTDVSFAKLMTIPQDVDAGTYNIKVDQNNNITFTAAEQGGAAIQTVDGAWFTTAGNKLGFTGDFVQGKQYAITKGGFAEIAASEGGGTTYVFDTNSLLTATPDASNVYNVTMTLTTATDCAAGIYGIYKTVDSDTTALNWTKLSIPQFGDNSVICMSGRSPFFDLAKNENHFTAFKPEDKNVNVLSLNLKTSGGITANDDGNGLMIDTCNSTAFLPRMAAVDAANLTTAAGGDYYRSFMCLTGATNGTGERLFINPSFILSGFNLTVRCAGKDHGETIITTGTLQAILDAFETRIHELEDKLKKTIDIDIVRPNS